MEMTDSWSFPRRRFSEEREPERTLGSRHQKKGGEGRSGVEKEFRKQKAEALKTGVSFSTRCVLVFNTTFTQTLEN